MPFYGIDKMGWNWIITLRLNTSKLKLFSIKFNLKTEYEFKGEHTTFSKHKSQEVLQIKCKTRNSSKIQWKNCKKTPLTNQYTNAGGVKLVLWAKTSFLISIFPMLFPIKRRRLTLFYFQMTRCYVISRLY